MLKLADFDYHLPKELIAQYPLKERDKARLLVIERSKGKIEHRIFSDIADYLKKDDLLVLNNTKVLASRIIGKRASGGKVEFFLLSQKEGLIFNSLIRPSRVRLGEKIIFNGGKVQAIVSGKNEVKFLAKEVDSIYSLGVMPLPPYIKREAEPIDEIYYQTVYAREKGAVASPTAGLHFTEDLIKKIESGGISTSYVTLHVGIGTFRPVKEEDITKHKMEPEYFRINDSVKNSIERAKKNTSRIIAVGTTSLRALEAFALGKQEGFTDLFIYPGFEFKLTDCLLTNFHLPRTTLFMLASAFTGEKLLRKAYKEAIDKQYRFYSYGDAMLIL